MCKGTEIEEKQPVVVDAADGEEKTMDATPGGPVVYTDDELTAMRGVRAKLLEDHGIEESRVGSTFLAVATINCKLRVDETTSKSK